MGTTVVNYLSEVEIQGKEEKRVKAIVLLCHDVMSAGRSNTSGFTGQAAASYKIEVEE